MTLAGQESANICDGELREPAPEPAGRGPTIVLADSHQETRQSMRRLLGADYQVIAVADGLAALEAARQLEPDLIVSEAAAPELDGFGLLKAIRSESALKHIAVVLVSARAGEGV